MFTRPRRCSDVLTSRASGQEKNSGDPDSEVRGTATFVDGVIATGSDIEMGDRIGVPVAVEPGFF
jgi:hypothetical protein